MTDTKTPTILRLDFYCDDFVEVRRIANASKNPLIRDIFYSVEIGLGEHDTENLIERMSRAVGMPDSESATIRSMFREYTMKKFDPETPPEF